MVVGGGAGSKMISGKASGKNFCVINPDLNFIGNKNVQLNIHSTAGIIKMWQRGSAARRKGKLHGERQGLWSL